MTLLPEGQPTPDELMRVGDQLMFWLCNGHDDKIDTMLEMEELENVTPITMTLVLRVLYPIRARLKHWKPFYERCRAQMKAIYLTDEEIQGYLRTLDLDQDGI